MDVRILDLDESLIRQTELLTRYQPHVVSLCDWAPHIRLACTFGRFRCFERRLSDLLPQNGETAPALTLCGSGDFHHVSLALVRRLTTPVNLLVLDNHPDWMRGVPFLHCGTWLYHAARLGHVVRVFHVGGDVDFDNHYQPMTPWALLHTGKITVIPAARGFQRGAWRQLGVQPLRQKQDVPISIERVRERLLPFAAELSARPLYISLDKDVMIARDAAVNWDSGHLELEEVLAALATFLRVARGNLAGMDIVGDWSPVRLHGALRHFLHWTEHPRLAIDPEEAAERNQRTNLALVEGITAAMSSVSTSA